MKPRDKIDTLTEQEIRSIHIVYRAMDDGVCPACGMSGVKEFSCIKCGFFLGDEEVLIIEEKINQRALRKRFDEFTKLRRLLGKL